MTRDDIIRMAREAGFEVDKNHDVWITDGYWLRELERFAELVAAAERKSVLATIEELYNMEKDRNAMFSDGYNYALDHIEEHIHGRRARELAQLNAAAEAKLKEKNT